MNIISAIVQLRDDILKWVATNLNKKVDKVDGKGLSSNDYTDDDKVTVSGVSQAISSAIADKATTAYVDGKFDSIIHPVTSVNTKTGDISLNAEDVGAEPAGTAAGLLDTHAESDNAHSDLFAMKADKTGLESLSDIVTGKAELVHSHEVGDVNGLLNELGGKANLVHGHDDVYYTQDQSDAKYATIDRAATEAKGAVSSHNLSSTAHSAYFNLKADKTTVDALSATVSEKVDKVSGHRLITPDEAQKLEKLILDGDSLAISGSVSAANVSELDTYLDSWVRNSQDESYGDDENENQWSEQLRNSFNAKSDKGHSHVYEQLEGVPNIREDEDNVVKIVDDSGNAVAMISDSGLEITSVIARNIYARSVGVDESTGEEVFVDTDLGAAVHQIQQEYATMEYVDSHLEEKMTEYIASVSDVTSYLGI